MSHSRPRFYVAPTLLAIMLVLVATQPVPLAAQADDYCSSPGSHDGNPGSPHLQTTNHGDEAHGRLGDQGRADLPGDGFVLCRPDQIFPTHTIPEQCTAVAHCSDGSVISCNTKQHGGDSVSAGTDRVEAAQWPFAFVSCGSFVRTCTAN